MSIIEDNNGNLWLGGAGGVYKINSQNDFQYVNTDEP